MRQHSAEVAPATHQNNRVLPIESGRRRSARELEEEDDRPAEDGNFLGDHVGVFCSGRMQGNDAPESCCFTPT